MSRSAGKIRDHAINAIITVAAAIFITSAVHVYEMHADHNTDVASRTSSSKSSTASQLVAWHVSAPLRGPTRKGGGEAPG